MNDFQLPPFARVPLLEFCEKKNTPKIPPFETLGDKRFCLKARQGEAVKAQQIVEYPDGKIGAFGRVRLSMTSLQTRPNFTQIWSLSF